jgi:hypothetical protein
MTNFSRRQFLQSSLAAAFAVPTLLAQQPANSIVDAAQQYVDTLSTSVKEKVLFDFACPERYLWDFVPLNDTNKRIATRKGISLDDSSEVSRAAALRLLHTSLGQQGFEWCRTIMEREAILAELEPRNAWFRKPGWYFVTFYGKPTATGQWGWRLDGHHLSVNCTIRDGQLISASPYFMGVNPVTIKHGAKKGTRDCITAAEDVARELFLALTPDQQKLALHPEHLPEVKARTEKAPALPTGLNTGKMDAKQQAILCRLVDHYFDRLPGSLARTDKQAMLKTGIDRLSFVYTGEAEAGKRHTYAIQGPTLFIHYLNEQTDPQRNPANHIHSIYRSTTLDFGGTA